MHSTPCDPGTLCWCLNSRLESLFLLILVSPVTCCCFFLNCLNISKRMALLSETGSFSYQRFIICSSCRHLPSGTAKLVQNGLCLLPISAWIQTLWTGSATQNIPLLHLKTVMEKRFACSSSINTLVSGATVKNLLKQEMFKTQGWH